ncbi:MAG: hypothetical protein DRO46_00865 [Candidatus Hecatellales archaeon]|nr:MAG: hypothetical protein DRO46_00865 [Candidatus Hecatellales archaeon]
MQPPKPSLRLKSRRAKSGLQPSKRIEAFIPSSQLFLAWSIPLSFLKFLSEIASKRDIGPLPAFGEIHVLEAIELLGSEGPIGRVKLSKRLNLGEGSVRTILKHLRLAGLVEGGREGYTLTKKGRKIYNSIHEALSGPVEIPQNSLAFGRFNVAYLVRKAWKGVRYGLEQRDAAIRVGGSGAVTLIYREGRLTIPGAREEYSREIASVEKRISESFTLEEGDVVIIGAGGSRREAELAAKAAALETLRRLEG